ncbi:MAG TPA: tetratricopeptide repeat protein [Candidatus Eisenbacteria bacterium]|nr:tetratricopeptide repeat protein [Candidatus Eisenbacteria bacterium]
MRLGVRLALLALLAAALSQPAWAAESRDPDPRAPAVIQVPIPSKPLPPVNRDEKLPDGYPEMIRKLMARGPADTLGDGVFALADQAFRAGSFDQALKLYADFAQRFTRNLRMNEALEKILMIRDGRDFDDEPLRIYARAESFRRAGHPDSAQALLTAGLTRYPGARLRWHFRYALAEIARDQGRHADAVTQALAVADTSAASRLAPYALKLAGDETLAMGGPPERAAALYQELLERFPDSPLATGVRTQVLQLRKRMQM